MNHWRARRLLAVLLDEGLPPRISSQVRAHTDACQGCRRVLREMELAEALVRRLPVVLLPLEPSPDAEGRLAALARWTLPEHVPREAGLGLPTLGALVLASLLAFGLWTATWAPVVDDPGRVTIAFAMADADLAPVGHWR